jgi:hypothetical protein
MKALLAGGSLSANKCGALHFGLAQVHDARGDFEKAAEHLVHANAIARAEWHKGGQGYQPTVHQHLVDRLIEHFHPEFFRARSKLWIRLPTADFHLRPAAFGHDLD